MSGHTGAKRESDAVPDISGDDEVHSEPTKVGDGVVAIEEAVRASLATPDERATSKMSPFQLESVLERLGESAHERSQARLRAPSLPPAETVAATTPRSSVHDRMTVPGPVPPAESAPDAPDHDRVIAPREAEESGGVSIFITLLAAVFVVLTCAVLFAR